MKDFPLISPCDYTLKHYIGFIQLTINNEEHEYPIEIKLDNPSDIKTASIYSDQLSNLLEDNKSLISQVYKMEKLKMKFKNSLKS
ncbi:hypothetical protein U3516DRAFT_140186 [Neocallimastix sp. 'constans']